MGISLLTRLWPVSYTHLDVYKRQLKAYATDEPLNQTCVDNRYEYVKKASAPYVQWLGQKENPEGAGWATGEKDVYKRQGKPL